jgi:kumamolisin
MLDCFKSDCRIRNAIDRDQPVLPSLSGIAPPTPPGVHSAPEIAALYNFPGDFDGRGVKIGLLEFGGNIVSEDVASYFKSLSLPAPDITPVFVDGAKSFDSGTDAQVMLDVEIVGAIAPRASIRVYFVEATKAGAVAHAIMRAAADGVAVLSIGWGNLESSWKDEEIKEIDAALEMAARQQITVLASVGWTGGPTGVRPNGAAGGRPQVDFPASSQWVLAVGGTTLKSEGGHIKSETIWSSSGSFETGGGVSDRFDRPEWQSSVSVPNRADGKPGRAIPDVVASADPALGVAIIVHGRPTSIGGTSASVPVWAGLIARINQALGHNVGHLNPRLYQQIGPEGVLRAIADDGKGADGAAGWRPLVGWGSPDGVKLLNWLGAHPDLPDGSKVTSATCQPN